ncbi:MAG TPA: hypothetical protein DEB06_03580 [Phycisphaerales bacterium]|nr:hypothetical protein [Phycisphaerales bacterium]
MNWLVFALVAWVVLGMEVGLRDAFQIGTGGIAPSFLMVLVVFVSLWARPTALLGAALVLGVLMDLVHQVPTTDGETAVIVGPWALGCAGGAYAVLSCRTMMFRRHPITAGILAAIAGTVASAIVVALLRVRSSYDGLVFGSAASELWPRLASAAYTGVVAVPMSFVLHRLGVLLGFRRQMEAAGGRRD